MLNVLWHIYKQKQIWTPHFFFQYTVDEESRLANLFWTDSQSHLDYACFGDVVAFDTTYKTNVYQKSPYYIGRSQPPPIDYSIWF